MKIIKTSDILLQDIKAILLKLAGDEGSTGANPWLYRAEKLLMSLLPIVITLEQSGTNVSPSSLVSLDLLEQWISELEASPEFQMSRGLLFDVKQCLAILPGYKEDSIGKQAPWTHEKYAHHIMMARSLCDASRTQKPRSLGISTQFAMCDDLATKQIT